MFDVIQKDCFASVSSDNDFENRIESATVWILLLKKNNTMHFRKLFSTIDDLSIYFVIVGGSIIEDMTIQIITHDRYSDK